jgi:hypothetical protein
VIDSQLIVRRRGTLTILEPDHLPELLLAILSVEKSQNAFLMLNLTDFLVMDEPRLLA